MFFDPVVVSSSIADGDCQERNALILQPVATSQQLQWPTAVNCEVTVPHHHHHHHHHSCETINLTSSNGTTTTCVATTGLLMPDHFPPHLALPTSLPTLDSNALNKMLLPVSTDSSPGSGVTGNRTRPIDKLTAAAMAASKRDGGNDCDKKLGIVKELVKEVKNHEDVLDWAIDYADACKIRERERLKSEKCYARLSPEQKRKESSRIEARVHKVKRERLEKAHVLAIKYLVDLLHVKRNRTAARKMKKVVNAVLLLQRWRVPPASARFV